jgi:hypothetical protein
LGTKTQREVTPCHSSVLRAVRTGFRVGADASARTTCPLRDSRRRSRR